MVKNDRKAVELLKVLNDPYLRLNNLYWILNEKSDRIKFRFNKVQEIFYWALWWLNIIPKSRQHGITTFICLFFLDACLFNKNVRAGIIAHRMEDAERIFRDKVKYAYDNLPAEVKSMVRIVKETASELMFSNGSSIYVAPSMRSGTLQYLHVSEYAYTCIHAADKAQEIKTGALPTIHEGGMVFIESTSEGVGNDFHSMCEVAEGIRRSGRELTRLDFKIHFFGWHDDPRNSMDPGGVEITADMRDYFDSLEDIFKKRIVDGQRAWYVKQKAVYGTDIYRQHPSTYEEAFTASAEGTYFGPEMAAAKENNQIDHIPWDPTAKVFTFWDTGNIYNSICFFQFKGERINAIDHYFDNLGQGLPHYAKVLQDRKYVYGEHFCGPDLDPDHGSNKKSFHTGEKTIDVAARLGIRFKIINPHSFDDRIRATKEVIRRTWFDKDKCASLIMGLQNFRRRKNSQLSTTDRQVFFDEPVKDTIDIHIADSFGHMAVWYASKVAMGQRIGEEPRIIAPASSREKKRSILLRGFVRHDKLVRVS